ncbi:unnamed protein product [Paramecium sonneborni]|uniref:Transmembrane protein n=1 Tax=Paramecium sonneborni TaxID=65129 RepID=A0A8S1RNS7_9CILI|nr:unnamed protein product [Paramecium sonneborni]
MINISFSRSSQNEILMIKFLNNSFIYSNEGYPQIETEVSCLIPKVIFLNEDTIAQVQLATNSNFYMLYFIGAMCGGSVLLGGVEVFFNLLDTLQMLSYLKYLNTQFPYNLSTYFQLFGFAQFNFIQKFFDFSGFIDQIFNTQELKQIPTKIANDGITSLFVINAATIITVWISLFFIFAIAKVIQSTQIALQNNQPLKVTKKVIIQTIPKILQLIKFKFFSESQTEGSWLVKVGVYYLTIKYIINRLCFTIVSEFFYSGILRAHIATAYDFTFSVVLQLYALELNSSNMFIRLSSLLACVASAIYLFSIYFVIALSQMKKYALNNKAIQTKYGSIFDGIKIKQFSKYLNTILLIKKLIFMILLIFAYEFPIFQTVSITFLSISMSLFYILFNPLEDKLEYFKQLFSEVTQVQLGYFPYEIQEYFGWACIFLEVPFQKVQAISRLAKSIL